MSMCISNMTCVNKYLVRGVTAVVLPSLPHGPSARLSVVLTARRMPTPANTSNIPRLQQAGSETPQLHRSSLASVLYIFTALVEVAELLS